MQAAGIWDWEGNDIWRVMLCTCTSAMYVYYTICIGLGNTNRNVSRVCGSCTFCVYTTSWGCSIVPLTLCHLHAHQASTGSQTVELIDTDVMKLNWIMLTNFTLMSQWRRPYFPLILQYFQHIHQPATSEQLCLQWRKSHQAEHVPLFHYYQLLILFIIFCWHPVLQQ